MPRIHVVALPHTETTQAYDWCAFTSKTRKFVTMMTSIGYDVRLYASETNEAICAEHIPVVTKAEQKKWFGHYNWNRDVFNAFDAKFEWWQVMNARVATEIRKRAEPGDLLGLVMGLPQQGIVNELKDLNLYEIEIGIGYTGVISPFRIYESYALQHYLAGKASTDDVRPFDAVIPNFFEVEAFPQGKGDGGYYLFIGRVFNRKGPQIAARVCKHISAKLIVAGQGVASTNPVIATDGTLLDGNVEYVGVVDPVQRAKLMGGAKAVFVPTIYLEPFGGVAVEAMLCGTPVITTDWGAFTETVIDGVTGFRCQTFEEFVEATEHVVELDRDAIRKYAIGRYSTDVVKHQYDKYFKRLLRDYPRFVKAQSNHADVVTQKEKIAQAAPTADNLVSLSLAYYQVGRYRDCIIAATSAVGLNPNYAEAHNNIAVAHHALGEWDLAIVAALAALRIKPGFVLAQNNLVAAQTAQRREAVSRS